MRVSRKLRWMTMVLAGLLVSMSRPPQVAAQLLSADEQGIRVELVLEKQTIMLGEPIHFSFIVLNDTDKDVQVRVGGDYRNALGRPESFTIRVASAHGKAVPEPEAGPGFGGLYGPQKIPAKGNYTFRLFLPHWAAFEEVGRYSIVAKRTLELSEYTPERSNFNDPTTNLEAEANTTIEVVPRNSERMGEIIAALGSSMLDRCYDIAESAARSLHFIQDDRVIPYFERALETSDYARKFTAIVALSKFSNETAFQALKKGMETKARDIDGTTTREVATQLAENIRGAAAAALAKSPHPEAIRFLLSKRGDTSEGVRITILHVLGKMDPEEARPILEEMTHDRSKRVSDEARRYLNLISSKD